MPTEKKFSLFIACDEAQHSCNKSQYNEASILEKAKLSIHLLFCRACQKYSSNNGKLTKLMKKQKIESFNSSEKNKMEEIFQQQLKNTKE